MFSDRLWTNRPKIMVKKINNNLDITPQCNEVNSETLPNTELHVTQEINFYIINNYLSQFQNHYENQALLGQDTINISAIEDTN